MNDSTHKPKPPINSLTRENTSDALTAIYCSQRFLADYVYLTISRPDTPSKCTNIGFFNVMYLITEALEYEIAKVDPDWDGMKGQELRATEQSGD